jgi:hypothetical protein
MRADFVELLVASGAVDALASLFALHDRPKQDVEPVPPAILAGLRMLEALLDARVPAPGVELGEDHAVGIGSFGVAQSKTTFVSDCESPAGSLIAALRETALAGLPSLLTSVLLQTEATLRTPVGLWGVGGEVDRLAVGAEELLRRDQVRLLHQLLPSELLGDRVREGLVDVRLDLLLGGLGLGWRLLDGLLLLLLVVEGGRLLGLILLDLGHLELVVVCGNTTGEGRTYGGQDTMGVKER